MADYLSEDLRIRVIEAVEAGSSRRGAAARFGVSVSSAIRWVDVWRRTGRTAPYPRGGDRRSGRIEGAAAFLLAKVEETPDITLAELQALLKERDLSVGTGTVWRFFDRHGISFKKGSIRELYALVIECLERQEVGLWTARVSKCGFRRRAG